MTPISVAEPRTTVGIRPFDATDIPQVARLHARVWPNRMCTYDIYEEYFRRVYLESPAIDPSLPSLVFEDQRGRIVAFIGVVPRRMVMGARSYRVAVSSQFIVDPGGEAAFVAVRLLRAYLDGPQDVSIADEATDAARALWEGLGGSTMHLLSMYWTRVLRPARYAASLLRGRRSWTPLAWLATPWAAAADALVARLPGTPFQQHGSLSPEKTLSASTVVTRYPEFCHPSQLRAEHDERSFRWLLERVAEVSANDRAIAGLVTGDGRVRGWYIASLGRDRHCDVLHLAAARTATRDVIDHLFAHAWRAGAVAISGRMDPRFMQALSDTYCVFHRRGPWMVVKTDRPEVVHAFESGNACFARIDGEWPLRLTVSDKGEGSL